MNARTFAYLNVDGHVVFFSTVADSADPPTIDGYTSVEVTTELPSQPSKKHKFHVGRWQWEELRTLEEIRFDQRQKINASRLAATAGTFTFAGKEISCDAQGRADIDGINGEVAITGQLPTEFPGAWKAVDNTWVDIPDVATWTLFIKAMVTKGTQNFAYAQSLKNAIDVATTIAEVEAITW